MRILGIETSCDETAIGLYDTQLGLLGHKLHSQTPLHQQYGGVVPELASRDHIRWITPLVNELLQETNTTKKAINGIAFTRGPGLAGALLVGSVFAKALAWSWNIPLIGVHHMEGHLLAPMLETDKPNYPFITLLVSGGHTQLILVKKYGHYQILGETLDDAAGEAFDKTAALLNLSYPGGPAIAKLAQLGHVDRFHFPLPMLDKPNLNFSFSGLKTYTRNLATQHKNHNNELTLTDQADIACGFEHAVVKILATKSQSALQQHKVNKLVVAGGVSANLKLRQVLSEMMIKTKTQVYFPRLEFCTDNGAMIALAGALRLTHGQHDPLDVSILPKWPMNQLPIPLQGE